MSSININRKILNNLKVFNSLDKECAKYICGIILKKQYKNIYLTGGKSLITFYKNFSFILKKNKIYNLNFFLTDERIDPKLLKNSNYNLITSYFLKYSKKIFKFSLKYNSNEKYKINFFSKQTRHSPDLIILSLGKEGHIASIFKFQKVLKKFKYFEICNPTNFKFKRITINTKYINSAKQVIIFAKGKKKSFELKKLFTDFSKSLIKKLIRTSWILDKKAYKNLNFKV